MKKIITILAILAVAATASAQNNPTTTWPYLYPEFTQGTVYLAGGNTVVQDLNIHIRHDHLHYADAEGIIKEASLAEVMMAIIGEDRYVNIYGEMMKVIAQGEKKGFIVAEILGDFAALQETGGAYGVSSTTSATRRLSSIETDSQINQNHMLLQQSRSDGTAINLVTNYYLVTSTRTVKATKRDVENAIPQEKKAEWKAWLKKNKVKWNNPESLVKVVDYISE